MDISSYAHKFEQDVGSILKNRYSTSTAKVVSGARLTKDNRSQALIADYAVYMPSRMVPSLIVETKVVINDTVLRRVIVAARRSGIFKQGETRFILATPDKKTGEATFFDLTSFIEEGDRASSFENLEALNQLPDLDALATSARASNVKQVKKRINKFKWTCRALAIVAIAFLPLDYLALYELSWERLALLAAICILLLLPYIPLIKHGDWQLYLNPDYVQKDSIN